MPDLIIRGAEVVDGTGNPGFAADVAIEGDRVVAIGNLGGWILNAQSIKPGCRMPPNHMTGSELQDLLAYLEALK